MFLAFLPVSFLLILFITTLINLSVTCHNLLTPLSWTNSLIIFIFLFMYNLSLTVSPQYPASSTHTLPILISKFLHKDLGLCDPWYWYFSSVSPVVGVPSNCWTLVNPLSVTSTISFFIMHNHSAFFLKLEKCDKMSSNHHILANFIYHLMLRAHILTSHPQ